MNKGDGVKLSVDCSDVLLKNLNGLLNNSTCADVVLECLKTTGDEVERIYMNSLVFALWCKPLYHAIQARLKEGEWPCRLICKDKPAPICMMVLKFMYTGRCTVDASNVNHLHSFARKWCIPALQVLCEDFVNQNGNVNAKEATPQRPPAPTSGTPNSLGTPDKILNSPPRFSSPPGAAPTDHPQFQSPTSTPNRELFPPKTPPSGHREPFAPISPNMLPTPGSGAGKERSSVSRTRESGTKQRARSLRKGQASFCTSDSRYREPSSRIAAQEFIEGEAPTVVSTYSASDSELPSSPTGSTVRSGASGHSHYTVTSNAKFVPGRKYLGYSSESFEAVDAHALGAPASAKESLNALATYLMQGPTRDRDLYKLRVIFRWMCNNIIHEGETNFHNCSPPNILKTGKTTCLGFANFLSQMADLCGMGQKVFNCEGYCKGRDYTLPFTIAEPNHAWNIFKLDGEWYLMDATWAAGSYGSAGVFEPDFDEFWFLTPPELFAYSHYPSGPSAQDQLLLPPHSKFDFLTFQSTPALNSHFFKLGLRLGPVHQAVLDCDGDTMTLEWEHSGAPPAMLTKLYPWLPGAPTCASSSLENCVLVQHASSAKASTKKVRFCITLPKPGAYKLELFAKPQGSEGTYKPLLWGYRVQRSNKLVQPPKGALQIRYPELFEPYSSGGVWMVSPAAAYVPLTRPTEWVVSLNTMADQVECCIIRSHHQWAEMKRDSSGRPFFVATFQPSCLPIEVLVTHKGDEKAVRTVLRYGSRAPMGTPFVYLSPRCAQYGVTIDVSPRVMPGSAIPPYNPTALTINSPKHIQVTPVLVDASGLELEDRILQIGPSTSFQVKVSVPKPGQYTLKLFAALEEQGQSLGIGSLPLQLDTMHIGPCLVRQTGDCSVMEPMVKQLKAGTRTRFRVMIPGASVALIVNSGRRLYLQQEAGEVWAGDFELQACNNTMVGASTDPNDPSLGILLKYVVV